MKGQKPKPLAQRIAEGDRSAIGRHKLDELAERQPKAQRGLGDPPSHVTGLAREQWFIWKRDLEIMGIDFAADAVMLEAACVNYARAIEMDHLIKSEGEVVTEEIFDRTTGDVIGRRLRKHPAVAISAACWKLVHSFASDMGLSVVSRARLAISGDDRGASDELFDLLMSPAVKKHRDPDTGEMIIDPVN